MLYSQTEPVLESSSDIKYYCINYSYPELSDQMIESGLSIWNNQWYKQFDFTPNKKQSNFELIQGYGSKILSKFDMTDSLKTKERKDEVDVSDIVFGAEDEKVPTIPVTMGESLKLAENNILLLFKHSDYLQIVKFYQNIYSEYLKSGDKYWLKDTREIVLSEEQIKDISALQ